MPRGLRYVLALAAMIVAATSVFAQPAGGGSGRATPTPIAPATRPPVIQDFQDILDNPDDFLAEFMPEFQSLIDTFVRENRAAIDANLAALPDAIHATLTRVLAILAGLVLLAFPAKTKVWSWLLLGAVLGIVFAQIPAGEEFRVMMAKEDLRFLLQEPQGTLGLAFAGALFGIAILSPLFFLGLTAAGSAAGALLALQLVGGNPDMSPVAMAVGGFIGFVLIAYALGRGTLLVPLVIGAGLVVFGLGLSATLMLPLILLGGIGAATRSARGQQALKRTSLPRLTLQEGKVTVAHDSRSARQHLHEILPSMGDDRDNPLIKR